MSEPERSVPQRGPQPASVEGALAQIITRAATWMFGRDSTVIVLIMAIGVLCYGIRWVAIDVVPQHIESVTSTVRTLEIEHRAEREKDAAEWRATVQANTEQHQRTAAEAHQQTRAMLDQIERLVTGRKVTSAQSPASAEKGD